MPGTATVSIPASIAGVDVKWIVRSIIDNMLACKEANETQNAYAHSLMIIRDRLWSRSTHGKGVRGDLHIWQAWRASVVDYGEAIADTWDGYDVSDAKRRRMGNAVLRDLARCEKNPEVEYWWLMFLVDA